MSGHISTERMHDLVDGLVPEAERTALDDHLRSCAACRDELTRLQELVGGLGELPSEATAPAGLWEGIEARIEGMAPGTAASGATVLSFPSAKVARRRVSLTVGQLAAAAAVVAVISAGVVWAALAGRGAPSPVLAGTEATAGATARMVASGSGYAEALGRLEAVVERERAGLAPETLATLERSLATVDSAIAEVEEALRNDPNSELLARLLANHQGAKLRVLRNAVARLEPRV